jgi:glutamine phosphoribosylpyrophosphate amidotransferase
VRDPLMTSALLGAKWVWPCDRDGTALAHNCDLTNTGLPPQPGPRATPNIIAELLAGEVDRSLMEAILRAMPRLAGAFSPPVMDERISTGCGTAMGIRALSIGNLPGAGVRVGGRCLGIGDPHPVFH